MIIIQIVCYLFVIVLFKLLPISFETEVNWEINFTTIWERERERERTGRGHLTLSSKEGGIRLVRRKASRRGFRPKTPLWRQMQSKSNLRLLRQWNDTCHLHWGRGIAKGRDHRPNVNKMKNWSGIESSFNKRYFTKA